MCLLSLLPATSGYPEVDPGIQNLHPKVDPGMQNLHPEVDLGIQNLHPEVNPGMQNIHPVTDLRWVVRPKWDQPPTWVVSQARGSFRARPPSLTDLREQLESLYGFFCT